MHKNRYGHEYNFEPVGPNTYKVVGKLSYWRYGGIEGQDGITMDNLGFADPSGGPFLELGMQIEGREITRIRMTGHEEVFLEVANG